MNISIHKASLAEQEQADKNSYSTWGKDESVEEYLARCKSSVRRGKAQCWVLTVDGVVASALGCLPLQFYVDGDIVDGFGIASVYTREDMRKRGFAEKLCQHVIADQRSNNVYIGLLFSDVNPGYYEKMGFTLLSQTSHDCRALTEFIHSGPRASLQPFEPTCEIEWLQSNYHSFHGQMEFALARDEEYWKYSIQANSDYLFWGIMHNNKRVGYVRVATADELWAICECVINTTENREELLCGAHRQIAFLAQQAQATWITSWQRPPKILQEHYTQRKRSKAWPMIMAECQQDILHTPIYVSDYF